MPLPFIMSGIFIMLILSGCLDKFFYCNKFSILISLSLILIGYFVGSINLHYFSINIFNLCGVMLLVLCFFNHKTFFKSLTLVTVLSMVYYYILNSSEELLMFYSSLLYFVFLVFIAIISFLHFKKMLFELLLASLSIFSIDLYFELRVFDYYFIDFATMFDVVLFAMMIGMILNVLYKRVFIRRRYANTINVCNFDAMHNFCR